MKKLDKKHRLEYQDTFLYSMVTSRLINQDFHASLSSPFTYKNGERLDVYTDDDVIIGIGQRNFQRDELYNSRGRIIMFSGYNDKMEIIVGKWDKIKNVVILYPTEKLCPEQIKVLGILQKHLTSNNITVIIDMDEKMRYRNEIRRRRGDVVMRRNIPTHNSATSEEEEDFDD